MQWFKHDTTALNDAKIKKLIIRHGAIGYAVYFHCLELIAGSFSETNITFELEHDSEIIADNLRITGNGQQSGTEIVETIMRTIVDLGLFEQNNNQISCFKLLKRLDTSMTSNPKFRKLISDSKKNHDLVDKNHDTVMIPSCCSHDTIMQEKNRKEEIRIDIDKTEPEATEISRSKEDTPVKKTNTLSKLGHKKIYDEYISLYKYKYIEEPNIMYNIVSKRITSLLKTYTTDMLIYIITELSKDKWWSQKENFVLMKLLSDNNIANIGQRYSPPKPSTPKQEIIYLCKTCGKPISEEQECCGDFYVRGECY